MNIILTGFMGTGKTTVGRLLADRLSMKHLDTDLLIEKSTGMSIPKIFSQHGEKYFRLLEAAQIKQLAKTAKNCVLSTGGKTLLPREHRDLLLKTGIIITLKGNPERLWGRLQNDFSRPLIDNTDKNKFIELSRKREPLYEKLPNKIDVDDLDEFEVTQKIIDFLKAPANQLEVKAGEKKSSLIFKRFLLSAPEVIIPADSHGKVFLVCDQNVFKLYKPELKKIFPFAYLASGQDQNKNLRQAEDIWKWLIDHKVKRDSVLVSIGGGVIGDLAGFIASTIVRGIKHYHIPTTLLAMVDSSIGGKNGLNYRAVKNVIGTFNFIDKVFIDPLFLHSLGRKELANGLIEALKASLIGDSRLFDFIFEKLGLIQGLDLNTIEEVIYRAILVKKKIVEEDPFEKGPRKILNFGHTLAHALESAHGYRISHGEAVGLGMICALKISELLGLSSSEPRLRLKALFERLGLKLRVASDTKKLIRYMRIDKKSTEQGLQLVLLKDVERPVIKKDISEKLIIEAMKEVIIENPRH